MANPNAQKLFPVAVQQLQLTASVDYYSQVRLTWIENGLLTMLQNAQVRAHWSNDSLRTVMCEMGMQGILRLALKALQQLRAYGNACIEAPVDFSAEAHLDVPLQSVVLTNTGYECLQSGILQQLIQGELRDYGYDPWTDAFRKSNGGNSTDLAIEGACQLLDAQLDGLDLSAKLQSTLSKNVHHVEIRKQSLSWKNFHATLTISPTHPKVICGNGDEAYIQALSRQIRPRDILLRWGNMAFWECLQYPIPGEGSCQYRHPEIIVDAMHQFTNASGLVAVYASPLEYRRNHIRECGHLALILCGEGEQAPQAPNVVALHGLSWPTKDTGILLPLKKELIGLARVQKEWQGELVELPVIWAQECAHSLALWKPVLAEAILSATIPQNWGIMLQCLCNEEQCLRYIEKAKPGPEHQADVDRFLRNAGYPRKHHEHRNQPSQPSNRRKNAPKNSKPGRGRR